MSAFTDLRDQLDSTQSSAGLREAHPTKEEGRPRFKPPFCCVTLSRSLNLSDLLEYGVMWTTALLGGSVEIIM